jgi:lactose/L-arabinose transport system permease protein
MDREKETVNKKGKSVRAKERRAGWIFLMPATIMILIMSFWPMIQAFITSFKTGTGKNFRWADPWNYNYIRMFQDKMFMKSDGNTFLYLIIQVPIMLVLAILLAQLLTRTRCWKGWPGKTCSPWCMSAS